MHNTATATRPRRKATRQQAPTPPPQPRHPMTPDQMAALDVLLAAAKPGLELAVGPAGTEVQLTARLKRAKRYGYGAPTAILFLDALPALDGLTRTEFRVLLRVLARAPFGDNIAPVSAAAIAREIGLDRSHVAAAIRALARARVLIEDDASRGTGRKFYRLNHALIWRGGAYGKHAAQAARPAPPIRAAR
jgi:DNA-binding MarR family transcriptional regulator